MNKQHNLVQEKSKVSNRHFNLNNIVKTTDLCAGTRASLSGLNIMPELGLINGAYGDVIDFNFRSP